MAWRRYSSFVEMASEDQICWTRIEPTCFRVNDLGLVPTAGRHGFHIFDPTLIWCTRVIPSKMVAVEPTNFPNRQEIQGSRRI